jgi:prolyl-tRNA synthetase
MLQALAETHHDGNGLTLPAAAAPFDAYLIAIPGKSIDTLSVADDLYEKLSVAGYSVLFDDREVRAGVKFNDADLIGPPVRITVGERALQAGNVEVKERTAKQLELISKDDVLNFITALEKRST